MTHGENTPELNEILKDGGRRLVEEILIEDMRALPYSEYLKTHHWENIRRRTLHLAGYRCFLCLLETSLDAHHTSYEHIGEEPPEDVVALCRKCHDTQHEVLRIVAAARIGTSIDGRLMWE